MVAAAVPTAPTAARVAAGAQMMRKALWPSYMSAVAALQMLQESAGDAEAVPMLMLAAAQNVALGCRSAGHDHAVAATAGLLLEPLCSGCTSAAHPCRTAAHRASTGMLVSSTESPVCARALQPVAPSPLTASLLAPIWCSHAFGWRLVGHHNQLADAGPRRTRGRQRSLLEALLPHALASGRLAMLHAACLLAVAASAPHVLAENGLCEYACCWTLLSEMDRLPKAVPLSTMLRLRRPTVGRTSAQVLVVRRPCRVNNVRRASTRR